MARMCNVSFYFWGLDLLHITDYHGVAAHCVGNVLAEIIRDTEFSLRTQADTIERHRVPPNAPPARVSRETVEIRCASQPVECSSNIHRLGV